MKASLFPVAVLLIVFMVAAAPLPQPSPQSPAQRAELEKWAIHDLNRPLPPVVDPGAAGPPAAAPSDAVLLFDGKDLTQWEDIQGGPAKWKVEGGYLEVVPKTGSIRTKKGFGDCQLHVEWATPSVVSGEGQERGNSGVFLMDTYEVQVLDSYGNRTYADGQAAAIYGQYPPLVNACRKPGEWQTYDIVFHRPRFDGDGKLIEPARMTVFHNGVLVHDNDVLTGPTAHKARPPYKVHADKLSLSLQDHGNPVRYRNIWLRGLE
jgi:3-keto-disaccharide hydrolase